MDAGTSGPPEAAIPAPYPSGGHMTGYRRHGPRFTWTNWWGAMLIHAEEDDAEVLAAEDEAIAAAERGPQPDGADVVALMEALTTRMRPASLHLYAVDAGGMGAHAAAPPNLETPAWADRPSARLSAN